MNEQLKFSWGHIITFLTLIVLSYVTFMGVTYKTDGNFIAASIVMVVTDIVLFAVFIGLQMFKATTRKFSKRIRFERILFFASPVIFILMMLPFYHFTTVQSQDDEIVTCFTDAISASKQMFVDYEDYSQKRIVDYEQMLDEVIVNKKTNENEFSAFGFVNGQEQIQKNNMVNSLRLQLLSDNYEVLKSEAIKWIESSNNGASTWNVFLLGNTKQIKIAIHQWNTQLSDFAAVKMPNEELSGRNEVKSFTQYTESMTKVDDGLDSLTSKFTKVEFPSIIAILCSVLIYFALLFPYILQDRHTKSLYRLIGMEQSAKSMKFDNINDSSNSKDDDEDFFSFTL